MTPNEIIDRLGLDEIADRLSVAKNVVGNWRLRGFPGWALAELSAMCRKAGINPGDALDPQRLRKAKRVA